VAYGSSFVQWCAVVCGSCVGTSLTSPRDNLTPAHNYRLQRHREPCVAPVGAQKVAAAGIMLGPCQPLAHGPNGVSGAFGERALCGMNYGCESSADHPRVHRHLPRRDPAPVHIVSTLQTRFSQKMDTQNTVHELILRRAICVHVLSVYIVPKLRRERRRRVRDGGVTAFSLLASTGSGCNV
jgi:hypothetical protein